MVVTRAARKRSNDDTAIATATASVHPQSDCMILARSEDEGQERSQAKNKRQRNSQSSSSISVALDSKRSRVLKVIKENTNNQNNSSSQATFSARPNTRARNGTARAAKPPPARIVTENPYSLRRVINPKSNIAILNTDSSKGESLPKTSKAPSTATKGHKSTSDKPKSKFSVRKHLQIQCQHSTALSYRGTNRYVDNNNGFIQPFQVPADASNIDSCDKDDPLAVTAYVDDIYQYYRSREDDATIQVPLECFGQPNITERMRSILIDWLLEVHYKFKLSPKTLYLTVSVLDRFLFEYEGTLQRREVQLMGITALLIAAKYEELFVPEFRDLIYICDGAYSENDILDMEERILTAIKYRITIPTSHCFLVRFLKASKGDQILRHFAHYVLDGTLITYGELTRHFLPSQLAAGALWIANRALGGAPWTPTLQKYTQYRKDQVDLYARAILHAKENMPRDLIALVKKYSRHKYGRVSELRLPTIDEFGEDM